MPGQQLKAVSIGGGTGQPRAITALRLMGASIDSVVAMADDGGSTGLLREREHVIPPGDVRKCLSALAANPADPLALAFAHRFHSIEDHALGNLLLVALAKEMGSFEASIRECERLLGCIGHVHPSTLELVSLSGRSVEGDLVHGQAQISYGMRTYDKVWLNPSEPAANEAAVRAILDADLIVLGPGSLFTSIVPNVLVPGIRQALLDTRARRVFVCPKIDSLGETSGMSVADHVDVLVECGLEHALDAVLVHRGERDEFVYPYEKRAWERAVASAVMTSSDVEATLSSSAIDAAKRAPFGPIRADGEDLDRISAVAGRVLVRDFTGDCSLPSVHDAERLAAALAEVMR